MSKQNLKQWLHPEGRIGTTLFGLEHTRVLLQDVFGEDMHLARVRSMANGVAGVLSATAASVAAIGRADEKIPYALEDIAAMWIPGCLAYGGNGWSRELTMMEVKRRASPAR